MHFISNLRRLFLGVDHSRPKRRARTSGSSRCLFTNQLMVEILEERLVPNAHLGGDTLGTALSIGALNGKQQFSSHVDIVHPNDFFVFTLSAPATVNATVSGPGFSPGVQIIHDDNSNGVVDPGEVKAGARATAGSVGVGQYAKSVGTILQPGTYYVRAFQSVHDSNYTLTLTADTAGSSLLSARNLGTLVTPGPTPINEYVGAGDPSDFYKFKLTGASTLTTIGLTGLSANADLYLLDSHGNTLASSTNGGTTNESISTTLAAGTYYVKVISVSGSTNYALSLTV